MKYLLILLILFSTQAYSKSPDGKGLICTYGKNKDIYEAYLFFKKKYISGPSFTTIAAFGTNGAVIHYTPTPDTDAKINSSGLFLGTSYIS